MNQVAMPPWNIPSAGEGGPLCCDQVQHDCIVCAPFQQVLACEHKSCRYRSFVKVRVQTITSLLHCGAALFSGKPNRCTVDIECYRPQSCPVPIPAQCADLDNPLECDGTLKFKGDIN